MSGATLNEGLMVRQEGTQCRQWATAHLWNYVVADAEHIEAVEEIESPVKKMNRGATKWSR